MADTRKPIPAATAKVMLACNNESGNWTGFVEGFQIEIGDDEWQFMANDLDEWPLDRYDDELRIDWSFRLPYSGYATWVGNMCWDQVTVTAEDAQRLLWWLRSMIGWACEGESGPHLDRPEFSVIGAEERP